MAKSRGHIGSINQMPDDAETSVKLCKVMGKVLDNASTDPIRAIFDTLLEDAAVDSGAVYLSPSDEDAVEPTPRFYSPPPETARHLDLSAHTALAAAVTERHPSFVSFETLFSNDDPSTFIPRPRAVAILPLTYRDRHRGAFVFYANRLDAFDERLKQQLIFAALFCGERLFRKEMERRARFLVDVEQTVHTCTTRLLDLAPGEICGGINASLKRLGKTVGARRVVLLLSEPHRAIDDPCPHIHLWDSAGQEERLQTSLTRFPIKALIGMLKNSGEAPYYFVPSLDAFPKQCSEIVTILKSFGIQSLILVSIVRPKSTLGWLILDNIPHKSRGAEEILLLLNIYASALGGLIIRERDFKAVVESETLWRSMFEDNRAVKLLIDPTNGAIIDANSAAAEFYGYDIETLRQMYIREINTLDNESINQEMASATRLQRRYFNFKHRRADRTVRNVEVWSSPITYKNQNLLYSIIHDVTKRRETEEALRQHQIALERQFRISEEKNIAIEQIADRLREQKNKIRSDISANVDNVLVPIIQRLKLIPGSDPFTAHFDMLERALRDITSEYGNDLAGKQTPLSPRETEICNYIRNGMDSKEIAKILGISPRSVENHRHRIRKKLCLQRNTNLSGYLSKI